MRVGVRLPKQGHEGVAWVLIFSLLTVLRAMRFVFYGERRLAFFSVNLFALIGTISILHRSRPPGSMPIVLAAFMPPPWLSHPCQMPGLVVREHYAHAF